MGWDGMGCDGMGWELPLLPQLPSVFQRDPTPPLKQNLTVVRVVGFNYPYYPNYRLYFRETPLPPLELNLMATTLTTPTTVCFLKRPHPHSVFILCAWYTIWVSIPIKSHVLSLFLAFITLSDLYYPHHPPSEGCTFRRQK